MYPSTRGVVAPRKRCKSVTMSASPQMVSGQRLRALYGADLPKWTLVLVGWTGRLGAGVGERTPRLPLGNTADR
jgi:hypothetical protein